MAVDNIARMMALDAAQQGGDAYTKAETNTLLAGKADLENGTIPLNQIPPAAIERMITVQDDTARFALTTDDVQLGDTVKVVSTNKMYLVIDTDHLDSAAGYSIYVAGRAAEAVADEDGNNIKSTYAKIANLATVATSGSYNDLSNTPTLGAAAAKGFDAVPTSGHTDYAVSSDGVYRSIYKTAYTEPSMRVSGDVTVSSGGYVKIGNLVVVSMVLSVVNVLSNWYVISTNMPVPLSSYSSTAQAVCVANDKSLQIFIDSSGNLQIGANNIPVGSIILSASYLSL